MTARSDKEKKEREKKEKRPRKREVAVELAGEFGRRIAARRERIGMSQEELAARADLDRSGLSSIELGESCPRVDTAVRLAGVLQCSVTELTEGMTWTPDPNSSARGRLAIEADQGPEKR